MDYLVAETIFRMCVIMVGALAAASFALLYFRHVRMVRPPIGVFNFRDIAILFLVILLLPTMYLIIPQFLLTCFIVTTFCSALYITLRPLLSRQFVWLIIGGLVITNIVTADRFLGTQIGLQLYWITNSIAVLLATIGVSNLYVQGGMRLRHVAYFTLLLALYDAVFTSLTSFSQELADRLQTHPLPPFFGYILGAYNGNIGIGDLLMYSLFTAAAYKSFGKKGVIASFVIITVFGAILPGLLPLIVTDVTGVNVVNSLDVPTQTIFGPAAFATYLWLARRTRERSMAEWFQTTQKANTQTSIIQTTEQNKVVSDIK